MKRAAIVSMLTIAAVACAGAQTPPPSPAASIAALAPAPAASLAPGPAAAPTTGSAPGGASAAADDPHCPSGMAYVSGDFCPKVERKCLHEELIKDEHITICHEFEKGSTKCEAPRQHRAYCIDRYEYPNEEGAHPPWMVSWYDAQATCETKGKRLCYESEWTMACEGPEETPFPNGWARDNAACNIDNQFIHPNVPKMYSKDPKVSGPELERIDQSVRSGALPGCTSGYGVHDLTGNFDEWVTREAPYGNRRKDDHSQWAGLKGGGWGHVRNACRPMTTSHIPEFAYYFISFRCCTDPKGEPPFKPKNAMRPPIVQPEDKAPIPHVLHAPGPNPPSEKVPKDRGY